jgi:addiction module HigA family antidote
MNNYVCQRPIHPGELLKEEIEYRKLKQTKLAEQMGLSYRHLNDILNCHRPLTEPIALLFEAALNIDAALLMRMQMKYNLRVSQQDTTLLKRLEEIRKFASML